MTTETLLALSPYAAWAIFTFWYMWRRARHGVSRRLATVALGVDVALVVVSLAILVAHWRER